MGNGLPENMQGTGSDHMRYFGEKFDAPITDDAIRVPTPTELVCMGCMEHLPGAGEPEGEFGRIICDVCRASISFDPREGPGDMPGWEVTELGDICPKCVAASS